MRTLKMGAVLSSCVLAAAGCLQVSTSSPTALIRSDDVAAGADCSAGGKKLSFGVDVNASGVLEDSEVTSSSFVCNGAAGEAGAAGQAGAAGAAGKGVVTATAQATAEDCAAGGTVFMAGVDDDADGTLDLPGEVDSTVKVCNGANGADGSNGSNGHDGATPVVTRFAAGAEGANCATTGGVKVVVGTASPVYVCNGEAGSSGNNGNDGLTPVVSSFAGGEEGTHCATTGGVKVVVGTADPVYVCNGATGTNGNNGNDGLSPVVSSFAGGAEGAHCATTGGVKVVVGTASPVYVCNGEAGSNGSNGYPAVVKQTPDYTPTAECPYGTVTVVVGVDDGAGTAANAGNGTLDNGEADTTFTGCLGEDADGDSIPYRQDTCPGINSPENVDSDSDGVGDLCDETPCGSSMVDCDQTAAIACVDLQGHDVNNCGACGVSCNAGESCSAGVCFTPVLAGPAASTSTVALGAVGTPWSGEMPIMTAWDGTHFWFVTGTDRMGGRIIKTDASLNFVADYSAGGDNGNFRSVVTKHDGVGPVMVTRAFDFYISSVSDLGGSLSLSPVSQLLNAAGDDVYSWDPVLTWDDVNNEWLSRTGSVHHRFGAGFNYLGSFDCPGIDASWGMSLVAYKGRLISYEDNVSPRRLVVYTRDCTRMEQVELTDGPAVSRGLSLANGKLWLSNDDPINGSSFKMYDVLK